MKFAIALCLTLIGTMASADQYKTVKVDASTQHNSLTYSYPELFQGSVPAYASINAQIQYRLQEGQCADRSEQDPADYFYNAEAVIVALNKRYVGMQITVDTYCGGAHPNYYTYYRTFDANTGNLLDLEKEFGITSDLDSAAKVQAKLAKLLVDKIPADNDCYKGMSRKEVVQQLIEFCPVVHGLAKNKTVVLGITPPHVATVCRFEARFNYAEIKSLLIPGSYLHKWLP